MNLFNRAVLVLLCVLLVIAAVSVITLTWTIPNRSINWLRDAVDWIDANDGDVERALLTTLSAFIGLVAVIVLLIELLPRRGPDVRVTGLSAGNATLSAAAIGQRIEEAVCLVPHVSEVRADVKARKKGVIVSLDLHVDPEANLATVTDEACSTAEQVLSERVHVAMLRPPAVRLHYRELRLQGRGNGNVPRRVTREEPPIAPPPTAGGTIAETQPLETEEAPVRSGSIAVAPPPEESVDEAPENDATPEDEKARDDGDEKPV